MIKGVVVGIRNGLMSSRSSSFQIGTLVVISICTARPSNTCCATQRLHIHSVSSSTYRPLYSFFFLRIVQIQLSIMKAANVIVRRTQGPVRSVVQQSCSSTRRAASFIATQHITSSIRQPENRTQRQTFSTRSWLSLGLTPDSEDPKPPQTEASSEGHKSAAHLTDSEFHEIADQYLNSLVLTLEEMADSDAEKGLEVEYSVSH